MTGEDRMDKQVMREQFEAWHSENFGWEPRHYDFYWNEDHYEDEEFQWYWECWQASREAVEVELPEPVEFDGYYNSGFAMWPCEVRSAIEAQGLKVKS